MYAAPGSLNGNRAEAADRLLAANLTDEAAAEHSPGPRGAKVAALHATFSDLRFDIEDVICDGASVVVRLTMSGRHTVLLVRRHARDRPAIPDGQIHIWRGVGRQVTDHWAVRDLADDERPAVCFE